MITKFLVPGMSMASWIFGLYGGGDEPEPPAVPSPTQVSESAVQAQAANLPEILRAQQEFGPQFVEAQLALQEQFAPRALKDQLALQQQFAPGFAEATRDITQILRPEAIAGQERLLEELQRPLAETLSPEEEAAFQRSSRAATSVRGLGESGFGALEEVRGLTDLRNQLRQQRLNLALSTVGAIPTQPTQMPTPQVSAGQLVQNVQPATFFGGQQAQQSTLANIFGTQEQSRIAQRGQNIQLLGDIVGGGSQIGAALATGAAASDIRLKDDLKEVGKLENGIKVYTWKWNEKATEVFGLVGRSVGVIAQEAQEVMPDAIIEKDGYLMVNYDKILGEVSNEYRI